MSEPEPVLEPAHNGGIEVAFPDSFLGQLRPHIMSASLRDAIVEAVRDVVEKDWESYLVPGLNHDGAVGTPDGLRGAPALWFWFWTQQTDRGVRAIVFNDVALQEPPAPEEDDTGQQ